MIETDWELVTTARAVVDSRGQARMAARLDLPAVSAPQTIEVEAQALDQGGRAVAANGLATWYPADLVLGVRAEPGLVAAGRPLHVAAVAVTPEGAPVAGTAVRIEWIERTWHTVMRQMVGGRLGYDSELVETVLDSAVVTTSGDLAAPAGARFVPPRPGSYTARARAADARGRSVRAADFAHAGGPGFVPWSRESGNRLVLVADRAAYSPGDTATILIESPFPRAAGLLTVEREGIREVIPFTATSAAPTVRVPLGESAVPNVFASIALVRGSAPPVTAPDDTLRSPTPEFRLGYILLPVKPDGRKLAVRVTSPERAGPGDSVRVTIDVTRAGEGVAADAEVTLLLVDEAVLRLTGTPTPDPFAYFYRTQGLGVLNAAKTREVVAAPEAEEKGLFPGGGGGDSGRFRRLFAATAVYLPALATGRDGRVEARFRLPDNLTTFRAMAIACDRKDRVGHGEAALTVTRPLVLDPVLPRLARVGDTFAAAAVVTNRTDKKLKIRVDFRATGDAVETTGKTERTVTLEAGRNRRVSFPLRARAAGAATIEIAAQETGKKHGAAATRDAVSFPFRVEEPLLETVAADYGVLAGTDSLALVPISVPAAADPARSALAIQVSTSLIGGIEPALQYLLEYPHGCLEQIDSRLIGLAVARELAPRLILSGWDEKRRDESAKRALAELSALLHYDGGYRVWPDAGRSDPYLSAYTLAALIEARDAGIQIDAARLTELARYLKERFDAKRPAPPAADEPAPKRGRRARPPRPSAPTAPPALSSSGPPFDAADALLATLLARERRNAGSPLRDLLGPGDVERLAVHERDLDREGHLLLAAALDLSHPYDARVGQILGPILDDVAMTGGRAFLPAGDMRYANDEMTTALALRVLLAAWPDHPLVVPMGRWLATERRNGTWRTTHATAQAVLALRDLARLEGDPAGPILAHAALPAAPLFSEQLGGRAPTALRLTWSLAGRTALAPGGSTTLTLARAMPAGVSPEARVSAPLLYHTVALTTARPALALAAAEDGLILERRAYPFDPLAPRAAVEPGATARTGDVVRLEITLVAPRAVTDVAIEDPLPAGLEPLLLDLETVARSLGRGLDERAGRGGYGGYDGYDGYGEYGGGRAELDYVATGGVFPAIRVERRDDRVAAFATALPAGVYRFEYLARAATPGTFAAPPATVELMYDPEVNARTGPLRFTVTETSDRENR